MSRLIDADALSAKVHEWANDEWNKQILPSGLEDDLQAIIENTPSVSAITAMYYYYEERDREYAERMDDIWKNM